MINEYLFLSDECRSIVEHYKPNGVTVETSNIENTPLWVAVFSVNGKNADSAQKLSDVHNTLTEYSPLVLSCESSEYYNRMLFPLVNELERKLRKLLYLAVSISDNTEAKKSIQRLEEKDFGEIFDLLFIDMAFVTKLKTRVNADAKSEFNGKSKYSKEEIRSYLDGLEEKLLWDVILGKDDVPTLRKRFRDVQTYRNDVMHAHNIGVRVFGKADYLFKKINKELDIAIGKLIGQAEDNLYSQDHEVNNALTSAITTMELTSIAETINALQKVPVQPGASEFLSRISQAMQNSYLQNSSAALTSGLQNLISVLNNLPDINAIKTAVAFLDTIKPFQEQVNLPPTIAAPSSDQQNLLTHDEMTKSANQQGEDTPDKVE